MDLESGPSGRLFRPANFAFGQFGVGCMMRAVTAFLSLPLACGDDVRLGNLVDVSLMEHPAPAWQQLIIGTKRVLDLTEQEGMRVRTRPATTPDPSLLVAKRIPAQNTIAATIITDLTRCSLIVVELIFFRDDCNSTGGDFSELIPNCNVK